MTVNLIPMGTWALADQAVQRGYKTRMLHLGLEWIETGRFSALPYLKNKKVPIIAIPLHWHSQSYDVLEIAREIKREMPEVFIVTGGYTASYFHKDIIKGYSQIDAVIRGDAEVPFAALLDAIKGGIDFSSVPNMTWRQDGETKENPMSWVAAEADLEAGSYANLSLLERKNLYIHHMGMPFVWSKGISREMNRKYFHLGHDMFCLAVGRGCTGNCTWCGGGAQAQKRVNNRKGIVFRAPERVVETIAEAKEAGYEMIHLAFDPGKEAAKYYAQLFPMIREKDIHIRCYFESYSVPSEAFLKSFSRTFNPDGSIIAVSPESGDEQIRRHNKSFFYTNQELMASIAMAEAMGIRTDVFFAMGIPGETDSDLAITATLRKQIKKKFKNIGRIWTSLISIEPAAPWFEEPTSFGIVSERKTFADYVQAGSPDGGGLGYYIPDFLGNNQEMNGATFEKFLRAAKCRDHCSFHPNPKKASSPLEGRIYCHYMNWVTGRQPWIK